MFACILASSNQTRLFHYLQVLIKLTRLVLLTQEEKRKPGLSTDRKALRLDWEVLNKV
jgi:hypothetical protein